MPYLVGDEGWMGSLRRKCEAFSPPLLSVPRSPDISVRQTVHPATPLHARPPASNKSPSHIAALTVRSKGFGHSHSPKLDRPPAPFPRATSQLARTFVDRCTDTAHHVAFSSLALRESLLYFRFSYGSKRRSSLHQKTAGWSSRKGVCDSAKRTSVVCAPKPHPSSIFTTTLDLAGYHPIGRKEHQVFTPFIDPCPK